MRIVADPPRPRRANETDPWVGPGVPVGKPVSQPERAPVDDKAVRVGGADHRDDGGGKGLIDTFVGVQRQHPLPSGRLKRPILLGDKPGPVGADDAGAKCDRPCHRVVLAPRIEDHDLVGEGYRTNRRLDTIGLVLGDDHR